MNNPKIKSVLTLVFSLTVFCILLMSEAFAAIENTCAVELTVKNSKGEEIKENVEYTDFKVGDKLYITAFSEDETAKYWAKNINFMKEKGFKVNEKGMALLGYKYDKKNTYISSEDPTQLQIVIPELKKDIKHYLTINAVAACDGLQDSEKVHKASKVVTIEFTLQDEISEEPEVANVIVKIEHEDGRTLKNGNRYADINAGDKIYVSAYCDSEKAVYWSQNANFMNSYGYKMNDKGMAAIGYFYSDIINGKIESQEISQTTDPTNAVIRIPNFEPGTEHMLSIQALGTIDNMDGNKARSEWIRIYFTIPELKDDDEIEQEKPGDNLEEEEKPEKNECSGDKNKEDKEPNKKEESGDKNKEDKQPNKKEESDNKDKENKQPNKKEESEKKDKEEKEPNKKENLNDKGDKYPNKKEESDDKDKEHKDLEDGECSGDKIDKEVELQNELLSFKDYIKFLKKLVSFVKKMK